MIVSLSLFASLGMTRPASMCLPRREREFWQVVRLPHNVEWRGKLATYERDDVPATGKTESMGFWPEYRSIHADEVRPVLVFNGTIAFVTSVADSHEWRASYDAETDGLRPGRRGSVY
jgi:hypothetical protein